MTEWSGRRPRLERLVFRQQPRSAVTEQHGVVARVRGGLARERHAASRSGLLEAVRELLPERVRLAPAGRELRKEHLARLAGELARHLAVDRFGREARAVAARDEAIKKIEQIKQANWLLFEQAEEMSDVGIDG